MPVPTARFGPRWSAIAVLLVGGLVACASASPRSPSIETGPAAVVTPDGLHRVSDPVRGTLYVKPDHGIGAHTRYMLGATVVTFERGSPTLSADQTRKLKRYLTDAAVRGMAAGGTPVVDAAGPCVVRMNFGVIDLKLEGLRGGESASTRVLASSGEMTLVMELRDSLSGEPLLRFGQRRTIEGGIHSGGDHPNWSRIRRTFDRMLLDQRRTLQESVPAGAASPRATRCLAAASR